MVLKLNLSPVLPPFWEPGDPTLVHPQGSWNHPQSALLCRLKVEETRPTIELSPPKNPNSDPSTTTNRLSGERVVVMSELCHAGEVKTIGIKVDSMHHALSQISQELANIRVS